MTPPSAATHITIGLGYWGVIFYTLIVIAGCVGYAVVYYNWLRDNAYQGERARLHGAAAVILCLGLFVALAFIAQPS